MTNYRVKYEKGKYLVVTDPVIIDTILFTYKTPQEAFNKIRELKGKKE